MIFASIELAAELERAERGLIRDGVEATRSLRGLPDSFLIEVGGGVAAFTEPGSPFNKVAGVGFDGVPSDQEWEFVESEYRKRGAPVQVELANLATPEVAVALTKRGYVLVGYENELGRRIEDDGPEHARGPITIEKIGADGVEEWLDVVVEGFASPDEQGVPPHESFTREMLRRLIGDMVAAPGTVRFLARCDGEAAGGASMRIDGKIAQCCGAATVPRHRRKGVQTALFNQRIQFAMRAGCSMAAVTTAPGSKSHENAQRRGFELLYTRAMLVLENSAG